MKLNLLVVLPFALALLLGGLSCSPYPAASAGPTPTATPQATPAATPAAPQATPAVDTTPPAFIYVKVQGGFWDVPQILWQTNEPVTGRIEYGSNRYEFATLWTVNLAPADGIFMPADLMVMTNYFVRVRVKDAAGNETLSKEMVIPYQELDDVTYNY